MDSKLDTIETDTEATSLQSIDEKEDFHGNSSTTSKFRIEDPEIIIERIKVSNDLEDVLVEDAEFVIDKLKTMDTSEALKVLGQAYEYFQGDMNFPLRTMDKLKMLLQGSDAYGLGEDLYDLDLRLEATLIKYHSPYPEVRSVCSPVDDACIPCETFRVYLIAGIWTAFATFVNSFLYWRQPHFTFTSQVMQILIVPTGQFYSRFMPDWRVGYGEYSFRLNPGPWSFKEQVLATIMINAGSSVAIFLCYVPTMQLEMFYGLHWLSYGFNVLMGLCCQFFGLAVAGILRRWVVYPVKAVWPTILPTLQLNRTLVVPERRTNVHGWTVSKYKFFNIVLGCAFVYFFIPDYLFTALSTFNWPTWIAPQNNNLAIIMGSSAGLGFNPVTTFDWSMLNYSNSLVLPCFAILNRYLGTFIGAIIIIIMIYTNYESTAYIPPNTSTVYDRYGVKYNTTRVMTDGYFDAEKYKLYSPPFISAGAITLDGADYTLITFAFVYIFVTEWKTITKAFTGFVRSLRHRDSNVLDEFDDPVSKLMRRYPEVPDWWYIIVLLFAMTIGIIAVRCFPTQLPVWAFFAVIGITIALLTPGLILYASAGYMFSIQHLTTLLGGYWVPGSGIACIFTRVLGFGMDEKADLYVGDLKLAHYAKLPPRAVFRVQVLSTLIQVFISGASWEMLRKGIPDLCSLTQKSKYTCTFAHTMYSQSLLFGLIGPKRTFDEIYPVFKWAFLIGALIAVPCWFLRRLFPRTLHYWHPVLILSGVTHWGSTYNLSYYTSGVYLSVTFMWYIKTRYTLWWAKYNYILSSALTAGTAFSGILIFLALQYHPKELNWWGNTVSDAGVDGMMTARVKHLAVDETLGSAQGTWS
ncbi:OPT oligopeptide transporter protein-domain-containing protein [Lipomyces oligophaga]|uniref:OPT oligopeptide transporter protein-domain-containing protein n=1 Tax=Lipomyces oligophaga TaxID=45792 RepID=UPI0034CD0BF3